MQTIPGYRLSIPYTRMSNHPPNTSNCFCSICRYTRSIRRRPVYYNLYIMEQSVGLPLLGTSHIPQLTQPALWMLASASGITHTLPVRPGHLEHHPSTRESSPQLTTPYHFGQAPSPFRQFWGPPLRRCANHPCDSLAVACGNQHWSTGLYPTGLQRFGKVVLGKNPNCSFISRWPGCLNAAW